MSRFKLYLLAFLLIATGLGLIIYKHVSLGFPLLPGDNRPVWTIESTIQFTPTEGPVELSFALPNNPPNMVVLDEGFAALGYGFEKLEQADQRRARWTSREVSGKQTLYYRLDVAVYPGKNLEQATDTPSSKPVAPAYDEPFRTAAFSLVKAAKARSSNNETLAAELIKAFDADSSNEEAQLLLGPDASPKYKTKLLIDLLAIADVPSRVVRGLFLQDGRRKQPLADFIEVYTGTEWVLFDPESGIRGVQDNLILWQRGGQSLLDIIGGRNSEVSFSMISNERAARDIAVRYGQSSEASLVDFSIYSLPISEQNAFKYILLVPIGALIVVIMRIIVGLRTSGTFMPILIALALIKTSLLAGLAMFLVVVSTGLVIRSYLSRLNLLLVARISAVIIVVVVLMAGISIFSHKLGMGQTLTVTFFPMIILAWTIERMSILWEEEGPHEVMLQGGGSLLVAVVAYVFMTHDWIEYLTFNFPELLLVNLGLILILGNYAGYRLSELVRFSALSEGKSDSLDKGQ